MATKYQKFGLRADKNLVDLENKNTALGNLLEGLTVDPALPFRTTDVEAIIGLRNTDVTPADIIEAGSDDTRVTYTPIDDPNNTQDVQPIVRIVDRIENYRVITGTPNFISGGDGPNAWIFPGSQLGSNFTSTSTGADVLPNPNSASVIGPTDFWDNGVWSLGVKVDDTFNDTFGGMQFEGYTSLESFTIDSTGLYIIEADYYGTGYEVIRSVYAEDRAIEYSASADDGSVSAMTLTATGMKHVNVGDFIVEGGVTKTIQSIDTDTQIATFDELVTGLSATGGTITLTYEQSSETPARSPGIYFRRSYTGDKYKMRITVWWQDRGDGDRLPNKSFEFVDQDSERYPFTNFYKTYDRTATPVNYTYENFAQNKASPTKQSSDVALETSETLSIQYTPSVDVSDKILISNRTGIYDGFGKILCDTSNIKVGDWLVFKQGGALVPQQCAQVIQTQGARTGLNDSAVYVRYYTVLGSLGDTVTFDVVDTIGLIGIYNIGAVSGGVDSTISVLTGSKPVVEVKADYLCADNAHTKFKRITDRPANNRVVAEELTGSGVNESFTVGNYMLVYASSGLKDLSSEAQCAGVIGKELASNTSNGGNTITLTDNQGLVEGMYVQFLTGTSAPNRIATSTQIATGGISGNTVTLTNNVIGAIAAGATIVFVDETTYDAISGDKNREYCILPLNTAPPFSGTADGLATPPASPNIKFNGLQFTNLYLNNTTSASNSDTAYTEYLTISYNGTDYKALIK